MPHIPLAWSCEGNVRKKRIPLRPVVLGGDDMTIICRAADIVVAYADAYIQAFETETGEPVE